MITSCLLDLVFYVLGEWDNDGKEWKTSSSFNVSAVVSMFSGFGFSSVTVIFHIL